MQQQRTPVQHLGPILGAVLLASLAGRAFAQAEPHPVHTSRERGKALTAPVTTDSFTFCVFGDRTSGVPAGLKVLARAVGEVNLIRPDFVFTVGDLVQGYTTAKNWVPQAKAYKKVMNTLHVPWYPVVGNHDVYWKGKGKRPPRENEPAYEDHFGPLWYAFEHKGSWFVALHSDEGPPGGGKKTFRKPAAQKMSPEQFRWLGEILGRAKGARHVFLFLHHPRWTGGGYGDDWKRVHELLKQAGNVSAVFAGHHHRMHYDGETDGISYFTLATTGGKLARDHPGAGYLHHVNLVTVRPNRFDVATLPVGTVVDPRKSMDVLESDRSKAVLKKVEFQIKSEERRTLSFPLRVPNVGKGPVELHIGIANGADDSGDRGLYYRVKTKTGDVLSRGFTRHTETFWIVLEAKRSARLTLIVEDLDTQLTGKRKGNGGTVEAFVKY
jgi:hypothetical protein